MNRHHTIAAAAALLGILGAVAPAHATEGGSRSIREVKIAASEATAAAMAAPAPSVATVLPAPCARRVKVVYAGYGEAGRASCAEPAGPATR